MIWNIESIIYTLAVIAAIVYMAIKIYTAEKCNFLEEPWEVKPLEPTVLDKKVQLFWKVITGLILNLITFPFKIIGNFWKNYGEFLLYVILGLLGLLVCIVIGIFFPLHGSVPVWVFVVVVIALVNK